MISFVRSLLEDQVVRSRFLEAAFECNAITSQEDLMQITRIRYGDAVSSRETESVKEEEK